MRSRPPFSVTIAAIAGLLFLHLPLAFIFLYAFTTEEKSYQFPPPGFTLQWFGVAWNRPDIWAALGLSVARRHGGDRRSRSFSARWPRLPSRAIASSAARPCRC